MKLVAFASDEEENSIERRYRKLCEKDPETTFGPDHVGMYEPDDFLDADPNFQKDDDEDAAVKLFGAVQSEQVFVDPEEGSEVISRSAGDDADIAELPDRDDLKGLCEEPEDGTDGAEQEPVEKEHMPEKLLEAMTAPGCTWNALFRYIVKLRSAPGGSDSRWIKNARGARRRSRALNWHQHLVRFGFMWIHFVWSASAIFSLFYEIYRYDLICSIWIHKPGIL